MVYLRHSKLRGLSGPKWHATTLSVAELGMTSSRAPFRLLIHSNLLQVAQQEVWYSVLAEMLVRDQYSWQFVPLWISTFRIFPYLMGSSDA